MKKVIHYTLRTPIWYSTEFIILAVTSEGPRGRVNARYISDNHPTHLNIKETIGKFDTIEQAKSALEKFETIRLKYKELNKKLNAEMNRLFNEEMAEIDSLKKELGL